MKTPIFSKIASAAVFPFAAAIRRRQKAATAPVKLEKDCRVCRIRRRGAAAVEFAMVAPLFFLLIIGMIEFGRMVMVQQVLTNAAREGARKAVLDGSTASDVVTTVTNYMKGAKITVTTSNVTLTPSDPTKTVFGDPITVQVSVPFSQVSWLPSSMLSMFTTQSDITLSAQAVMRRETVQQ
jgi:Flp pilus assembly protein TadG